MRAGRNSLEPHELHQAGDTLAVDLMPLIPQPIRHTGRTELWMLLDLKQIRVANLLPAVVLAPLFVWWWG